MDFEQGIAEYLSAWGQAFIAPQFEVAFDSNRKLGGSSPDFVVVDFLRRDVAVVEVSGAYDLDDLIDRIKQREKRWYEPIHEQLVNRKVIPDHWLIRTIVFIRKDWVGAYLGGDGWAERKIPENDVTFYPIELAVFPGWFEDRMSNGLPNRSPGAGWSKFRARRKLID